MEIDESFDALIEKAAKIISDSDFILIASGAGFSSDSGLPVYKDVANDPQYQSLGLTYSDLADSKLLASNPELFWKFWGSCLQSYHSTTPHEGYSIIDSWFKNHFFDMSRFSDFDTRCYVYSSNVDGHFRGFSSLYQNLCEMHGCVKESICSSSMGLFEGSPRTSDLWKSWCSQTTAEQRTQCSTLNFNTLDILLPTTTLPSPVSQASSIVTSTSSSPLSPHSPSVSLVPRCPLCSLPLRPKVLLFDDLCPSVLQRIAQDTERYQLWVDSVDSHLREQYQKAMEEESEGGGRGGGGDEEERTRRKPRGWCVLEIGCGLTVPTVRIETETIVSDLFVPSSSSETHSSPLAKLIRINPDFPSLPDSFPSDAGVSIRGTALDVLRRIDEKIRKLKTIL